MPSQRVPIPTLALPLKGEGVTLCDRGADRKSEGPQTYEARRHVEHQRRSSYAELRAVSLGVPERSSTPSQRSRSRLQIQNNVPATHPITVSMQEAAKKILEESGGKKLRSACSRTTSSADTDMLSQLRSGALEMFTLSGNILSTLSKPTSLLRRLGYTFQYRHMWDAVDGDLGKHLRGVIEKLRLVPHRRGGTNGFRQITSSTPDQYPEKGHSKASKRRSRVR